MLLLLFKLSTMHVVLLPSALNYCVIEDTLFVVVWTFILHLRWWQTKRNPYGMLWKLHTWRVHSFRFSGRNVLFPAFNIPCSQRFASCTWHPAYKGVSKSFRTESITKYTLKTINTLREATQRVMAAKTH
jgi:hypothetical protein